MDHETDDSRHETPELQEDDNCVFQPEQPCIACGECSYFDENEGQPTEYQEWQDVFGGDEDPPTDIDDMS